MLKHQKKYFIYPFKAVMNIFSSVNKSPIWVLGNQKCGTTAIATLIAEYGALSRSIDFGHSDYDAAAKLIEVNKNNLSVNEFIDHYRWYFSKDLIKEPHLTFLFDEFSKYIPNAKCVFVTRDPRDNIRSILNRVRLTGNKQEINIHKRSKILPIWKHILTNEGLDIEKGSYIENLAHRWCLASDSFLKNREDMIMVRYEDFMTNKEQSITDLCKKHSINCEQEIASKVDIQYQPKGNSKVCWTDFFGQQNLELIERICQSRMQQLGYKI